MGTLLEPGFMSERLGPGRFPGVDRLNALQIVSERVRAYVGWHLDRMQETVTVEGTRAEWLDTGLRPMHLVYFVSVDGVQLGNAEYRWNARGRLWRACGWGDKQIPGAIRADYGYDELPDDLASVVLSATRRLLVNPSGLRSMDYGEHESHTFAGDADAFTVGELVVLNRYRRQTAA
jgi:hypothetical protein